ncbi:hypothetical protein OB971_20075 [Bacillus cereus]|nr:hypothetical protein [Bacillus cereus]
MYKLAILEEKEINIIKQLSKKEYQDLLIHMKTINTFHKDYKRLTIVKESHDLFEKLIESYIKAEISYQRFADEVNINILKYLASFKSFLDHWETHINRLYGKKSAEFGAFKKATAVEFDGHFSYRFIYELRNYTLHCDMPVSNVASKIDEHDNHIVDIMINRDRLLKTYKWPKKVGLESMTENFDIREQMKEALECLVRIHQIAINLCDTEKLYESALAVYKLRVDYPGKGTYGIIKFSHDNIRTPKSVEAIPVSLAEALLKTFVKSN